MRLTFGQGLKMVQKLDQRLAIQLVIKTSMQCPTCRKTVKPKKINWAQGNTDCRMLCPRCESYFQANLKIFDAEGVKVGVYKFLCPSQTLHAMRVVMANRKYLGEKFLRKKDPNAYFSMLKHFGAYKRAFKKL